MGLLNSLSNKLAKVGSWFAGLGILAMTALITFETVSRSLFQYSTLIADEVSGYLLVLTTYFGLAYVAQKDEFIRVSFFYDRIRGKYKRWLNFLIELSALAFALILTYYSFAFIFKSFILGSTSINISRTPLWIPQSCMGVGLLLLDLTLLIKTIKTYLSIVGGSKEE